MRKLPVRLADFTLDGEYEGWTFTARVNPPCGVLDDLASGVFSRLLVGAGVLIKNWNFVDEEGEPLGPPSDETIGKIPSDLLNAMLTLVVAEAQKLPQQSSRPS